MYLPTLHRSYQARSQHCTFHTCSRLDCDDGFWSHVTQISATNTARSGGMESHWNRPSCAARSQFMSQSWSLRLLAKSIWLIFDVPVVVALKLSPPRR